jgi:hypothetical protein
MWKTARAKDDEDSYNQIDEAITRQIVCGAVSVYRKLIAAIPIVRTLFLLCSSLPELYDVCCSNSNLLRATVY